MNIIPSDVIFHIFIFLTTPTDQSNITAVSKSLHHHYISSPSYLHKKNIIDIAYMVQEDIYINKFYKLLPLWKNIFKSHWPSFSYIQTNNHSNLKTCLWKINQIVDVKDKIRVWGPGKIIDYRIEILHSPDGEYFQRLYHINFFGWNKNYNEWVKPERITHFGHKCFNPNQPYKHLTGDHKRWCIYKQKTSRWCFASVRVIEEFSKSKKIMISPFQQYLTFFEIINKDNINDKLLYVSDATAIFSGLSTFHCDDHRKLQY